MKIMAIDDSKYFGIKLFTKFIPLLYAVVYESNTCHNGIKKAGAKYRTGFLLYLCLLILQLTRKFRQ